MPFCVTFPPGVSLIFIFIFRSIAVIFFFLFLYSPLSFFITPLCFSFTALFSLLLIEFPFYTRSRPCFSFPPLSSFPLLPPSLHLSFSSLSFSVPRSLILSLVPSLPPSSSSFLLRPIHALTIQFSLSPSSIRVCCRFHSLLHPQSSSSFFSSALLKILS